MTDDNSSTMSLKQAFLKRPDRLFGVTVGSAIIVIAAVILICSLFANSDLLLYAGLFSAFVITGFSLVITRNFIAPLLIIFGYNAVVMISHARIEPIDYNDILVTFVTAFFEISVTVGILILLKGKIEKGLKLKNNSTLSSISIILSAGILTVISWVMSN